MNCHACGTSLAPTARFCHKCGATTTTTAPVGGAWRVGLPWGIAGVACGALLAVFMSRTARTEGPSGAAPVGAGGAPGQAFPASDISQMSPEEQGQRLFDRVMRLGEEGKMDSVQFFMPMALGVYQRLPALSLDGHFDLGLLHLTAGDPASALAEADAIRQSVPTHLYGFVLRARALEAQSDARGATQAYRDFLKNETAERARRRPEYAEHSRILDAFHGEALTKTQGQPGG